MREWHPTDYELVQLSGGSPTCEDLEHVRSCARCRSVVSEYDWLEGALGETLNSFAREIPVRRSEWWQVQNRLVERRRRQSIRIQMSALTSAAMVVCLLLCAPVLTKPAVAAQALEPEPALRPTPIVVPKPTGAGRQSVLLGTASVFTVSRPVTDSSLAPALVPLPTPPGSER